MRINQLCLKHKLYLPDYSIIILYFASPQRTSVPKYFRILLRLQLGTIGSLRRGSAGITRGRLITRRFVH